MTRRWQQMQLVMQDIEDTVARQHVSEKAAEGDLKLPTCSSRLDRGSAARLGFSISGRHFTKSVLHSQPSQLFSPYC